MMMAKLTHSAPKARALPHWSAAAVIGCLVAATGIAADLPLGKIKLPTGFQITVFADNVENARQMVRGDDGTIYVGSRRAGRVYAITDGDNDYVADKVYTIDSNLDLPSGVAYRDGSLYVGAISQVLRYDNIAQRLDNPPEPVVVRGDLPTDEHHGWKFISFGPDGKLYVPVGAPCNVCDEAGYATIKRMNADGSDLEDFAHGVRNTVGFDWDPVSNELWFTDNGRDLLGDDVPPCELNHASEAGMHFGFPFCHGNDVSDPVFGEQRACSEFTAPAQNLGAHVAPLGMTFYTGDQFPEGYKNQIFIPEHGSWNRSSKVGYRITKVSLDANRKVTNYEPFATGWLQGEESWGRPAALLVMPDGSMLVSDDQAGVIYRIAYAKAANILGSVSEVGQ